MAAASDLTDLVERTKVYALNELAPGSHSNLWAGDRTNVLSSDADATLIIYVPFRETVRLSGVVIDAPPDAAPTSVRLYVNAKAMGFDDIESTEPAALVLLAAGDLGEAIKLRPAKFNAVNELFVFVEREDASKVVLSKLAFIGVPVQAADVSKIQKGHSHE